jgi:hypothetical protein
MKIAFHVDKNGPIKMFKILTQSYNPGLPWEKYHSTSR